MTRQVLSQKAVFSHIDKPGNIPSIPEILTRLLELCENDSSSIDDFFPLVSADPGISFAILKLANSSRRDLNSQFTSIASALHQIGRGPLKQIITSASIAQVFEYNRLKQVKNFNPYSFWFHSLLCAKLAMRIAVKTGFTCKDEAYLAGLIHDIGRIILIMSLPKEHETIFLKTRDKQNIIWAEEQLLGMTHCQVGNLLVQQWQIRSHLADSILYHNESVHHVSEAFPLVKTVYFANILAEPLLDSRRICSAADRLFQLSGPEVQQLYDHGIQETLDLCLELDVKITQPEEVIKQNIVAPVSSGPDESWQACSSSVSGHPVTGSRKSQLSLIQIMKRNTLLAGFVDKKICSTIEHPLSYFEKSMHVLFNVKNVVFFLPELGGRFLRGRTTESNMFYGAAQTLVLNVAKSNSVISKTYTTAEYHYLQKMTHDENIADFQLLEMFENAVLLLAPLNVGEYSFGVVLLALPKGVTSLHEHEMKILFSLTSQLAGQLNEYEEQKNAEKKRETEHFQALSLATRKYAHEINNPLAIIQNYIKTIGIKFSKEKDLLEELNIINEEIGRISSIVEQMGKHDSLEYHQAESVDINASLADIVKLVRPSLFNSPEKRIHFKADSELSTAYCSKNGLKHILINLLKNASEALGETGEVEVITGYAENTLQDRNGIFKDAIEIVVADNGPGLSDMVKANLYKPFITTKKTGHSGLGLSLVHKMVKDMKGSIECISNAEQGTRFTVYLPAEE